MEHNIYLYILVAAGVSALIRILPLTLIRGKIKNRYIRTFLFYLPYVTLAVMTFPAIIQDTTYTIAGFIALIVGITAAWFGGNLIQVAVACCAVVFVVESICRFIS